MSHETGPWSFAFSFLSTTGSSLATNLRDRFIEVFGEPKLNDVLLTEAPAVISEVTVVTFPARAVHFD